MMKSLFLLVAILVSLQCTFEVSAQDNRNGLDNNLPNVVAPPKRSRNMVDIRKSPPSTMQLAPGKQLVLKCEVIGSPAPTVQWMKNEKPLGDYEEESNDILPFSTVMLTSKLVVSSAVPGDVFTCVATSGLKRDSASTTVYTVDGSEIYFLGSDEGNLPASQKLCRLPIKPIITTYYSEVLHNMGTDIILPCRVHSFTKSQIFWLDNHEKVIYDNSRMRVLPSGDLLVTSLQWSDRGNFTCIARNAYGKDVINTSMYPVRVKRR